MRAISDCPGVTQRDLMASAWMADEAEEILWLLKLGVHSIATSRPALAVSLREVWEKELKYIPS